MIPRIQGKVGQATEPEEFKGKFFFEIWLTTLGGEDKKRSLGQFGPFETEATAREALIGAVRHVSEECERLIAGEVSGQYIDMKTNSVRRWDRANEH